MKQISILLIIFLTGCSWFQKPEPYPVPTFTRLVCENRPRLTPLDPLPVEFEIGRADDGRFLLGLSGTNYSNLAINNANTLRYLIDQKGVIEYLELCISAHNKKAAN